MKTVKLSRNEIVTIISAFAYSLEKHKPARKNRCFLTATRKLCKAADIKL